MFIIDDGHRLMIKARKDLRFLLRQQTNAATCLGHRPGGLIGVKDGGGKKVRLRGWQRCRINPPVDDWCLVDCDNQRFNKLALLMQLRVVQLNDGDVALSLRADLLFQLVALMMMMNGLYRLLQADSDEQADRDGRDVDEKIAQGVGGGVRRVDVQHGQCDLYVQGPEDVLTTQMVVTTE